MIHVATVHWRDDRWIDVQQKYFDLNMGESFQVYSFLNDIDTRFRQLFFYSSIESIRPHAIKLNMLADIIIQRAQSEDDLLMFIDGDAFPIANVSDYSRDKLREAPLIAVQRYENNGDLQPHPCFCVTTVGFWKRIAGDWTRGHCWTDSFGRQVSDVGGNLLYILESKQENWYPMFRTNVVNLHNLLFGIYDDIVYHHGAGFRRPGSRLDIQIVRDGAPWLVRKLDLLVRKLPRPTPIRQFLNYRPGGLVLGKRVDEVLIHNRRLSEDVFRKIQADISFYRMFMEKDYRADYKE